MELARKIEWVSLIHPEVINRVGDSDLLPFFLRVVDMPIVTPPERIIEGVKKGEPFKRRSDEGDCGGSVNVRTCQLFRPEVFCRVGTCGFYRFDRNG